VPDRSNKQVTGEDRDTYWKNNLDCKRPIPAKRGYSRGPSMTMGYTYWFTFSGCRHFVLSRLHYRPCRSTKTRRKATGRIISTRTTSSSAFTPGILTSLPSLYPSLRKILLNVAYVRKTCVFFRFSRSRYKREAGIMNPREKIETLNPAVKKHLEVISEVTSRRADSQACRELKEVRFVHWDSLLKEYKRPRWASLPMSPYCGRQRSFANFFNALNASRRMRVSGS